ncbi:MAG: prolipoprotein diacylglyceryl transferase [SAR86 cluster bacterium]|uniref:Phosphatidylglycerol--prolipoprotein diacylglyceryl transferase n=1 Tax=SAR86 cluster bacterium TaxID=2030880 RepID=A0A520N6U9_9GAMM|nr:MAG: prolipoprotein diacylglyceryl transferase [SAR86 cluster bacterium]
MIIELSDFFNNPSLVELGPIKIQYYAVTWLLSAVLIYLFLRNNKIVKEIGLSNEEVNDMVFLYGLFFGAMCGGRIGYMLFYGTDQLINDPFSLFYIWQGGLSFHGGLLGVIVSLIIFCKKKNIEFLRLTDGVALSMPIGLGLVRIGNFLNGELFGKATNAEWGFIFPTDPFGITRHPSQLYESLGEGLLLFLILLFISQKTNIKGIVSSSFLIFYGSIRFIIEFYRQPDTHIGYVAFDFISMGQLLCLPMIVIGFVILLYSRKNA